MTTPSSAHTGHPDNDTGTRGLRPSARQVLALFLSGAIALQIAQGLVYQRRITPYKASYWLVTYEHGFVRRGLAGEVLRRVAGTAPSLVTIEVVQYLLTAALLAALCLLVRALWQRNDPSLDLAAIVLCCSPFVFDFVAFQRRPDQIGYLVVLAIGFMLWKQPASSTVTTLVGGLLLAVAVLVSDSAFLACTGWAAVLVVLAPGQSIRSLRTLLRLALLTVPPAAMALVSATAGRLDAAHVQALAATASRYRWTDVVVFPYLADSLQTSLHRVADMPLTMMLGSVLVGGFLVLLQGWLMTGLGSPQSVASRRPQRTTVLGVGLCAVGLVVLLCLGIDWFRWISGFGLMAAVAFTFSRLMRKPTTSVASGGYPPRGVIVVSAYLLAVAAFPSMISVSEGFLQLLLAYNSAKP